MTGKTTATSTAASGELSVFQAVRQVRQKVGAVGKGGFNQQGNYNFRGIDALVDALGPLTAEAGLLFVPTDVTDVQITQTTYGKNHTPTQQVSLKVVYAILGPAGDVFPITVEAPGFAFDSGDKAMNKAMTAAWKIALNQFFQIPTGQRDPDSYHYGEDDAGVNQQTGPVNQQTGEVPVDWMGVVGERVNWDQGVIWPLLEELGWRGKAMPEWDDPIWGQANSRLAIQEATVGKQEQQPEAAPAPQLTVEEVERIKRETNPQRDMEDQAAQS